jgi:hypothetical protein
MAAGVAAAVADDDDAGAADGRASPKSSGRFFRLTDDRLGSYFLPNEISILIIFRHIFATEILVSSNLA